LTVPLIGSEDFDLLARRMGRPDPAALHADLQHRLGAMQTLASRLGEFLGEAP
jgi:hypothetical protein